MNGKTVVVKFSNADMNQLQRLRSGKGITVKYAGYNQNGTLLFPEFLRERDDVKWDNLLQQYYNGEIE